MDLKCSSLHDQLALTLLGLTAMCLLSAAAHGGREALPAPEPRVLNNFVSELLGISPGADVAPQDYRFVNPREGWVFFRTTANVLAGARAVVYLGHRSERDVVIEHGAGAAGTLEAMRWLAKGEHTVSVVLEGEGASVSSLVVRAIPEIQYATFPFTSHIPEYGTYDFAFLQQAGMLDNVNVLTARTGLVDGAVNDTTHVPIDADGFDKLSALGKRILERRLMYNPGERRLMYNPGKKDRGLPNEDGAAGVYEYWSKSPGIGQRVFNGLIIDEFSGGIAQYFPSYIAAIRRILDEDENRLFYLYLTGGAQDLVKPFMGELPTEDQALRDLRQGFIKSLEEYRKVAPGIERKMVFALGEFCSPPESLDRDPAVSFNIHLDIQFMILATDPAFQGLFGVQAYNSAYMDEEYLRWTAKLFRHYCIEGKTDRLSKDPYALDHIRNPDFEQGLDGWTVSQGEEGRVAVKEIERYGDLQGIIRRRGQGHAFLWTRRSAEKPNVISQEITNLAPGRTYSVKLYAGDYVDPDSDQKLAISVGIDGADMIADKSFQGTYRGLNRLGNIALYKRYGDQRAHFNFFRLVFRATSETATLAISDWTSQTEPGGPAGQELTYNFIQVQPYLDD